MGLDMSAYSTAAKLDNPVDFETYDPETGDAVIETQDLHYWRKYPNLHGWMAKLYVRKGGKENESDFTGPVVLTAEDLDHLEAVLLLGALPHTTGFFFGASAGSESELEDDMKFVADARDAIADGRTVYYNSSW